MSEQLISAEEALEQISGMLYDIDIDQIAGMLQILYGQKVTVVDDDTLNIHVEESS